MRAALPALALVFATLLSPAARAQMEGHSHHHQPAPSPAVASPPAPAESAPCIHGHHGGNHGVNPGGDHAHDLGPAGATYDLRWIDGMVQHHTGALRMTEVVFDIGAPGVGALAKEIWRDQAQEIKAMGQWRRAWYPEAPLLPLALRPGGNADAMDDLVPMSADQIAAMRMVRPLPSRATRVTWFLEGMLAHHGGALVMAHDALAHSRTPTIRRMAQAIIVAQRREIIQLRRMLQQGGLNRSEYYRFDPLFVLPLGLGSRQPRFVS